MNGTPATNTTPAATTDASKVETPVEPKVEPVAAAETKETKPEGSALGGSGEETKPAEGEAKPDEKKPDEKVEAKPLPVDDKWEPKAVEGVTRDPKAVSAARDMFKGLGLNAEQAQKLVEFSDAQSKASDVARLEALTETNKAWRKELESDSTLGGTNMKATEKRAYEAVVALGGKELARQLNDMGLGNWPPLVRAFEKAGRTIGEGSIKGTVADAGTKAPTFEQQLERAYPTMLPKKES